MMVVDASAILAVVLEEDDSAAFETIFSGAAAMVVSAVNYWEVLVRASVIHGETGASAAEDFMNGAGIQVAPADAELARSAAAVFARFGRHTPAKLNLGDCFAYALAEREKDGLLFKGDDFTKTDIKNARDG